MSFYSLVESVIPEILQVVFQKGLVAGYLNLYELEWPRLYYAFLLARSFQKNECFKLSLRAIDKYFKNAAVSSNFICETSRTSNKYHWKFMIIICKLEIYKTTIFSRVGVIFWNINMHF